MIAKPPCKGRFYVGPAHVPCLANEIGVDPATCHFRAGALNETGRFTLVPCQGYRGPRRKQLLGPGLQGEATHGAELEPGAGPKLSKNLHVL